MSMRNVELERETSETTIKIRLNPDGPGKVSVKSGIPFFDHMLTAMAKHGGFDFTCTAKGDLGVDCHHTIEDIGIVLGDAVKQVIGDGRGIKRFSHAIIPMDESLAQVALDCGGRGYLVYHGTFGNKTIGTIPVDIFEHFFYSLCTRAGITAHITFSGRNDHHQCEAVFKAFGIALGKALEITGDAKAVRSTKGKF
jgi:imidazoleglycerol-phosphate dehydratase